jgi:hypothetical protein
MRWREKWHEGTWGGWGKRVEIQFSLWIQFVISLLFIIYYLFTICYYCHLLTVSFGAENRAQGLTSTRLYHWAVALTPMALFFIEIMLLYPKVSRFTFCYVSWTKRLRVSGQSVIQDSLRSWALVARACGSSYSGGRDQEDQASLGRTVHETLSWGGEKNLSQKGLAEWIKL